jgi:deoxyribose-phosphate aldolase
VVLEPRDSEDFPNENELKKLIAMREAAGEAVLKVIIEAPLLAEREMRSVARMALAAGADFIKTCTGRRGSCSDEAADIFAYEIMRHELTFKEKRGVKLSGGIRTKEDVERLTELVNVRDDSIIASSRFRIGASSLLNELI